MPINLEVFSPKKWHEKTLQRLNFGVRLAFLLTATGCFGSSALMMYRLRYLILNTPDILNSKRKSVTDPEIETVILSKSSIKKKQKDVAKTV